MRATLANVARGVSGGRPRHDSEKPVDSFGAVPALNRPPSRKSHQWRMGKHAQPVLDRSRETGQRAPRHLPREPLIRSALRPREGGGGAENAPLSQGEAWRTGRTCLANAADIAHDPGERSRVKQTSRPAAAPAIAPAPAKIGIAKSGTVRTLPAAAPTRVPLPIRPSMVTAVRISAQVLSAVALPSGITTSHQGRAASPRSPGS
jgi:hypothetical protein